MNSKNIIALGFLILACLFMLTLLKGLFAVLKYQFKGDGTDFKSILGIFKYPLVLLVLFIIFIFYVIPWIEA